MKTTLKPGLYFIGDPCYVINESWTEFIDKVKENTITEFRGYEVFYGGTAWGDGTYLDNNGNEYPVDSGCLGIIPVDLIELDSSQELGQIVNFDDEFDVDNDGGIFTFGHIFINTDWEEPIDVVEEDTEWLWDEMNDDSYEDHRDISSYYED
jgi:hypothetical protein